MRNHKIIIIFIFIFFSSYLSKACTFITEFCLEALLVADKSIVVGTINNSTPNSVDLDIISVLHGTVNNNSITIWDGGILECNGFWTNYANDLGSIGDTVLCLIQSITSIENPWDIIGEYRRPTLYTGFIVYTNFSNGGLFEYTYTLDEVLNMDINNYCCDSLTFGVNAQFYDLTEIYNLPASTGTSTPIPLSGSPPNGVFSGPGVVLNAFNPTLAGPGNHTISYSLNDFGCPLFSSQQDIFVFNIVFNFVNYNLGVISPKIANQIDIELEVPKPDQYIFQVIDMNGKIISQENAQFHTGKYQQEIKLNRNLAKGIYLLKVSNSQTQNIKKFVVSN